MKRDHSGHGFYGGAYHSNVISMHTVQADVEAVNLSYGHKMNPYWVA